MRKRSRNKPKFQEIHLTGAGDRQQGVPFAMAYVYSRAGNYVVTGASDKVHDYIQRNHPRSFFRITFWKNGRERNGFWWTPPGLPMGICEKKRHPETDRLMWKIEFGLLGDKVIENLWFRRLPNRWLEIFDETIDYVDSMNGRN